MWLSPGVANPFSGITMCPTWCPTCGACWAMLGLMGYRLIVADGDCDLDRFIAAKNAGMRAAAA